MILAFDIGNTNITLGGYEKDKLCFIARLSTDRQRTADQYAAEIKSILDLKGFSIEDAEDAVVCSVSPTAVEKAIEMLLKRKPISVGPGVKTGLNIKIDNPAQLGTDLVAGAVGAMAKYPCPLIVIDMGTATTISVINKKGEFLGGAIAAGVNLTLEALTSKTAQLPSFHISSPPSVIGTNSIDSMRSGLVLGSASMLDGMIKRCQEALGEKATVVATGGLAGLIVPYCETEISVEDDLLLDGLYLIYKKNR